MDRQPTAYDFFLLFLPFLAMGANAQHDAMQPFAQGFIPNKGQLHDQKQMPVCEVLYNWPGGSGINVQVLGNGLSYDTYASRKGGRETAVEVHRLDMRFLSASVLAKVDPVDPLPGRFNFYLAHTPHEGITRVPHFRKLIQRELYPGIDVVLSLGDDADQLFKYDIVARAGADLSLVRMEFTGFDSVEVSPDELRFRLSGRDFTESIPASWSSVDGRAIVATYVALERSCDRVVVGIRVPPADDPRTSGALVIDPVPDMEWSTYLGNDLLDVATAIATDTIGMIYVAGTTQGMATTVTTGPHQTIYGGGTSDAFLTRIAAHGSRLWCTYYGGSGMDEATAVSIGDGYRINLAGNTGSPEGIATEGAYQTSLAGGQDAFVARFDSAGIRLWSTYLGGYSLDRATACAADGDKHVHVAGSTSSSDLFNGALAPPIATYENDEDAFIVRFDSAGHVDRSTFFGGAGTDRATSLGLTNAGDAYVGGSTTSTTGIATIDAQQLDLAGGSDGFLLKLDPSYAVDRCTYQGGVTDDAITGVVLTDTLVYATGWTTSGTWLNDTSAFQIELLGDQDAFILQFDSIGQRTACTYFGGEGQDASAGIARDGAGAIYMVGTTSSHNDIATAFAPQSMLAGGTDLFLARFDSLSNVSWATYHGAAGDEIATGIAVYGWTAPVICGYTTSDTLIGSNGFQMAYGGGEADAVIARFLNDTSTPCVGIGTGTGSNCPDGGNPDWCPDCPTPATVVCRGDSVLFVTSGGALAFGHYWMWYADLCGNPAYFLAIGDSLTIAPTQDMTLFVRTESGTTVGSCTSLRLIVEDRPIAVANVTDSVCQGSALPLNGTGGVTYAWDGPSGFHSDSLLTEAPTDDLSGTVSYVLSAFSQGGCSATDTALVVVLPTHHVPWTNANVLCNGGSDGGLATDLISAATHQFNWPDLGSTGPAVEGLAAGTYMVMVTDSNGCTLTDSLLITEGPHPIDTVLVTAASCGMPNGSATILTIANPLLLAITWDSLGTIGPVAFDLAPGAYPFTVIDPLGCVFHDQATVIDTSGFLISLDPDTVVIFPGDSVALDLYVVASHTSYTINWSPNADLSCTTCPEPYASPDTSTVYSATVISGAGCVATQSTLVRVVPRPCPDLFIPDHFSPNDDGVNDRFIALGGCLATLRIVVVDREGNLLFEGMDPLASWDGNRNGHPVQSGSYTCTLSAVRDDGSTMEWAGNIMLLR